MACPKCCACHDFASREPRARQHPSPLAAAKRCPCHANAHSDAQNAAPATTSAMASPKCCACHDFACQHTLRCTERCACHDCGNGISKVLRLPRFREPRAARATTSQPFRQLPNATPAHKHTLRCTECCACHDFGNGISKVLRLPRFREPRAARATTSQPFRQLPNAAPATQTHTQMHRMLRLPRLRQWHLQSAAPATISQAPSRARDNIPALDSCQTLPLPRKSTLRCTECCACHDFGNGIFKVLRLPRFREPRAVRATTPQPFRQLPNAAPATQTHTQMHIMLRLPRLRRWHLQSAAPATISRAPSRARDNIPAL